MAESADWLDVDCGSPGARCALCAQLQHQGGGDRVCREERFHAQCAATQHAAAGPAEALCWLWRQFQVGTAINCCAASDSHARAASRGSRRAPRTSAESTDHYDHHCYNQVHVQALFSRSSVQDGSLPRAGKCLTTHRRSQLVRDHVILLQREAAWLPHQRHALGVAAQQAALLHS